MDNEWKNFKPKPKSFKLFQNSRKKKESHPDYLGEITDANGVTYRLAGWKNVDKNGKVYLTGNMQTYDESNSYSKKVGSQETPPKSTENKISSTADIGDLPF